MGLQIRRQAEGIWYYPPLETEMSDTGLEEVNAYIYHRHNTFAQFIVTITIMDMCLVA